MLSSITRINSFSYGKKQTVFNLRCNDGTNKVYFADTSDSDSMTNKTSSNYCCLTQYNDDVKSGYTIHSLYNVTDARLKTPNFQRPHQDGVFNNEFDLVDVYAPPLDSVVDFAQVDGYVYLVTGLTNQGPYTVRSKLRTNSATDIQYDLFLSNDVIPTYLYRQPDEVAPGYATYDLYFRSLNSNTDFDSEFTRLFTPTVNLSGVEYNYIMEFPVSRQYNYYDQGVLLADILIGKNAFTSEYTMNVDHLGNNYNLRSCRQYVGVKSCAG